MKKTKKHWAVSRTRRVKTAKKSQRPQTSAGKARAEGLRLFKLAGRPTKEQVVLVYGKRGPVMTCAQRAAAGVPAAKFQATLAAKRSGRVASRRKPSVPALRDGARKPSTAKRAQGRALTTTNECQSLTGRSSGAGYSVSSLKRQASAEFSARSPGVRRTYFPAQMDLGRLGRFRDPVLSLPTRFGYSHRGTIPCTPVKQQGIAPLPT